MSAPQSELVRDMHAISDMAAKQFARHSRIDIVGESAAWWVVKLEQAATALEAAEREKRELREQLERALDSEMGKLLAMPDERIAASLRMEGHDPKDVATIAEQAAELAILQSERSGRWSGGQSKRRRRRMKP